MAQLVVRNLPEEVKARLQRRAKQHGRSLEAEVRAILADISDEAQSVGAEDGLGDMLAKRFARHKIDQGAWEEFEANLKALRKSWRVRDVDLGS